MLKNRSGFTLIEVMTALVLTAIIGAAVTGAFVVHSRFFDQQEKVGFARGVSRSAMNIIMSEFRMVELTGGVDSAAADLVRVRVPYALGIACANVGVLTVSRMPADPAMLADATFSGYAWREPVNGAYTYVENGTAPVAGVATLCSGVDIGVVSPGGAVWELVPTAAVRPGQPVLVYQMVEYQFKTSEAVPGTLGLFRRVVGGDPAAELVAPFDTTARFRFYISDGAAAEDDPPAPAAYTTITGLEITLDGLSERPNRDGTYQSVPLITSVFFKNRP